MGYDPVSKSRSDSSENDILLNPESLSDTINQFDNSIDAIALNREKVVKANLIAEDACSDVFSSMLKSMDDTTQRWLQYLIDTLTQTSESLMDYAITTDENDVNAYPKNDGLTIKMYDR